MTSRLLLAAALVLALALAAPAAGAQEAVLRYADSLLMAGQIARAESLYYREAARRPREPAVRLALGRYLAARRPSHRVGAVLMEEARYFGGNADSIGRWLASAYERLQDYKALSGLRGSPLSRAERLRVEFLARRPPQVDGPDSAWIEWLQPDSGGGLGAVLVVAGGDTLLAELDGDAAGLVVGPGMRGRPWLSRFPARAEGTSADAAYLASSLAIGAIEMTAVPVTVASTDGRVRLGLDVLERFAPEFDPAGRRIMLHRSGRVADDTAAVALPTLHREDGLYVAANDVLMPIDIAATAGVLNGRRWILDFRRGEIRFR